MLSCEDARRKVIEVTSGLLRSPGREKIRLGSSLGRILAEEIVSDRDYPPFDRAARDGFAVRASDCREAGAVVRVIGEVRAGSALDATLRDGECAQIMTGAAVPRGADAVIMVEQTRPGPQRNEVVIERAAVQGMNIAPRGSEARAGGVLLDAKTRMGYAEIAVAAQAGFAELHAYRRPRVAVLSTGDEVVAVDASPGPLQIRNSNGASLAAQVSFAGGEAVSLGNAPDNIADLREKIARGLQEDALVLSGGVSMGKYDLVEEVLRGLGAEILFDAIAIRPGRPAVFGICQGKPFFGLPGNPVSTMVTFELLVLPAVDILGGGEPRPFPLLRAKLAKNAEQKTGLTHFLPARLDWSEGEPAVTELPWHGSGDIAALARGNCFLVVHQSKLKLSAGEWVDVLPRRGLL